MLLCIHVLKKNIKQVRSIFFTIRLSRLQKKKKKPAQRPVLLLTTCLPVYPRDFGADKLATYYLLLYTIWNGPELNRDYSLRRTVSYPLNDHSTNHHISYHSIYLLFKNNTKKATQLSFTKQTPSIHSIFDP